MANTNTTSRHPRYYACCSGLLACLLSASNVGAEVLPTEDLVNGYFPLSPGNQWTYLTDTGKTGRSNILFQGRTIHKVKTRVLRNSLNGSKLYFTNDAEGIRLHRMSLRNVRVTGFGRRNLIATATPPILFAGGNVKAGDEFNSAGSVSAVIPGLGAANRGYSAKFTIDGFETFTIMSKDYDTIKLHGTISVDGQPDLVETLYLAKGIGIVKQDEQLFADPIHSELQDTNAWIHDLALTKIRAPKKVTLTAKTPAVTKTVKVTVQNRSPHLEAIADADMLTLLAKLEVHGDGACPLPHIVLPTEKYQKRWPLTIRPKAKRTFNFRVTFDLTSAPGCGDGIESFSFTAQVDHGALDGQADVHTDDDVCPRAPEDLPYRIDQYPDNTIKDKGCGGIKPDHTLGADVITSVISR